MDIPELDERGTKPLRISWSRLMDHGKCSMRGHLRRQGKRDDTPPDLRRFIHGNLADRAMRRWLEQDEPQLPGQMVAYVDDIWDELVHNNPEGTVKWKGDPAQDQAKVRTMAKDAVAKLEPFLLKRVLPFEYEPEFRFRCALRIPDYYGKARTIVLNGGMDIAVREAPGVVRLYDLKNTSNEDYIKGPIMGQLVFYALAWSVLFGPPDDLVAAYLTPNCATQYHPLTITQETKRHMLTRIVDYAHFVWQNEQPTCTDDNNECYWCDVQKHCIKFAQPTTVDKRGKHRVSLLGSAEARAQAKIKEK